MVQIQFLDTNAVHALVPVFSLKPDKVLFFYDRRTLTRKQVSNIEKAVKNRFPKIDLTLTRVDYRDFEHVQLALYRIFSTFSDPDIVFVNTGGTEVTSAVGQMISRQVGGRILFADMAKGCIRDVRTCRIEAKAEHVMIDDYLTAIGAKHIRSSHTVPKKEDTERILAAAEWTFEHQDAWHALQQYLAVHESQDGGYSFSLPETLPYNNLRFRTEEALQVFLDNGFVTRQETGYRYAGRTAMEYMTNYGIWLELYIYLKALSWFDEAYLGFVIDWDNSDLIDTADNEIDVLGMKDSMPCFISCKMRKPSPKDLYEVAYLANRFGGENARAVVATTYPVSEEKNLKSGLYNRFRKMGIGVLETAQFASKKPSDLFSAAVRKS